MLHFFGLNLIKSNMNNESHRVAYRTQNLHKKTPEMNELDPGRTLSKSEHITLPNKKVTTF